MLEADDARERLVRDVALDVGADTFDKERLNVDMTGDIRSGDMDNGELGSGGDALLLRDIGGLEDDHSLEMFSLEQAGIFVPVRLSVLRFPCHRRAVTSHGTKLTCRSPCT